MKRKYDEKLLEDALRDYPQEFLGEPLELLHQQPEIGGFRPDLIFKDQKGIPVIAEVQLKALDRNHLYRSLEYRHFYKKRSGAEEVRVILFCNSIPSKYETVLAVHNVDCRKIAKKEFLRKLISLTPGIKILSSTWDKKILRSTTVNSLLREIHKNATLENNVFAPDTFAFWIGVGSPNVISTGKFTYPLLNVTLKDHGFILAANVEYGCPSKPVTTIETRLGPMEICVPLELFVAGKSLEDLNFKRIQVLKTLLDLTFSDEGQIEISLGVAPYGPFGVFPYFEGTKKKFYLLRDLYTGKDGYDTIKIQDDLEWLLSLKVYTGKYPNFVERSAIKGYEIFQAPGLEQRRFYEKKRQELKEHKYEEKIIEEFDVAAKNEEKKWFTIRLNDVSREGRDAVLCFLDHAECHLKHGRSLMMQRDCCVSPPKKANKIPLNALRLTSKYFWHLHPNEYAKFAKQDVATADFEPQCSLSTHNLQPLNTAPSNDS